MSDDRPIGGHGHGHGHGTPPVLDEAYWEAHYAGADGPWWSEPNPQLTAVVTDLTAGRALDVGCGEGANSIWLARLGWQVTGVDLSATAIARARAHAREAGPDVVARTTWVHADLAAFDPGPDGFDLVSALFVHLPDTLRDDVHRRLACAVAPGGILLIVTHDPSDLHTTVPRPTFPEFVATPDQVADLLPTDGWDVFVADARPRTETDPEGRQVTVLDAVTGARRRGTSAPSD